MEWISHWFDRIVQGLALQSILSQFQWLDWVVVAFVLVGVIYGIRKGFMPILGQILQLVLVVTLTLEFDGKVDSFLRTYVDILPANLIKFLGFLIAGAIFWLIVDFVGKYLGKVISAQTSAPLKILGGAVGGGFYSFLFLSFISQAVLLGPWDPLKKNYEEGHSYTGHALDRLSPKIHKLITRPLGSVRSTSESPKAATPASAKT